MSDVAEHRQGRPLVAAGLATVLPGLGHAYLRARVRALLWVSLLAVSLWILGPDPTLSAEMVAELYGDAPDLVLFVAAIWAMNVLDAYLTANRQRQRSRAATDCPHCGKELDSELEFCHWCTARLDDR